MLVKCSETIAFLRIQSVSSSTFRSSIGLPEPQDAHAVLMVKFAQDCLHSMVQVTRKLAERLGDDTSNLSLRVGLHSGAVTGGVLRGERAR